MMTRYRFLAISVALAACACVAMLIAGCRDDGHSDTSAQFNFTTTSAVGYLRVDRMGLPAFATALISTANKDPFNQADPTDDAAGAFDADVLANLTALHNALDDDLTGLGLVPCAPASCITQLGGYLDSGDVLTIDPSQPSGFPNGRRLEDPVIDIVFALVLLDLGTHDIGTLASVSVNPPADDAPLLAEFPFLAPPQ
ncbi:MAG: DUF4331 domain-containing protein [Planctomycetes bacterium]|nr:DUF4331 domain-containing protein [Planctomycetota bacterium]